MTYCRHQAPNGSRTEPNWLFSQEIPMTEQTFEGRAAHWLEDTVDRTATSIEEIHKSIAEIPLDVMRRSTFYAQTAEDVSDLHERSIGVVYDTVRDVNRRIFGLASHLLRPQDDDTRAHSEQA
jgi:hypothetical protein